MHARHAVGHNTVDELAVGVIGLASQDLHLLRLVVGVVAWTLTKALQFLESVANADIG